MRRATVWACCALLTAAAALGQAAADDDDVAVQLERALRDLDQLRSRPTTATAELAAAHGHLGRLHLAYDQPMAAGERLRAAAELEPDRHEWLYLAAVAASRSGDLDTASDLFARAHAADPRDSPTLLRWGRAALDMGDLTGARRLYELADGLGAEPAAARHGLAQVALLQGDPRAAAELLEGVVEAQPAATEARYQLGLAYRSLGRIDEARDLLSATGRQPVRFSDPLIESLTGLGRGAGAAIARATRLRASGRHDEAVTALREAVETTDDPTSVRLTIASTLLAAGRPGDAARELRELVRDVPDHAGARYNLGTLLAAQGRLVEAVEHLARAAELTPSTNSAELNLAGVLTRLGKPEAALEIYDRALAIDPQDLAARTARAQLLGSLGRLPEALTALDGVLAAKPDDAAALLARSIVRERLGRAEAALDDLRALVGHGADPEIEAAAWLRLAELQRRFGESAAALEASARAVVLRPDSAAARLSLGLAHLDAGRPDDATTQLVEAVRLAPDSEDCRDALARAWLALERYGEAAELLESEARRRPDDPEVVGRLARFLAAVPVDELRDGGRALTLAQAAATAAPTASLLQTLAMALAEVGRIADAATLQEEIVGRLTPADRGPDGLDAAVERLRLYRDGRPARAPWLAGGGLRSPVP